MGLDQRASTTSISTADRLLLAGAVLARKILVRFGRWGHRARRAFRLESSAKQWRAEAARRRTVFYEEVWTAAAQALGGSARRFDEGLLLLERGSSRSWVFCNHTELDDPVSQRLSSNKPLTHRILRDAGIPVVESREFTERSIGEALEFLQMHGGPCVVKPARDTGAGQGVHTNIFTNFQLVTTTAALARSSPQLQIEQQVEGNTYRLLVLDGCLLDAVKRQPPTVTGDGRRTIRQLVMLTNQKRISAGHHLSQTMLSVDREMKATLWAQGLRLNSVLGPGEVIHVKSVINENQKEDNKPARIGESVASIAVQAAALLGLRFAGVDVITRDPTQPLAETGGVVLEVNPGPGFHYHYNRAGEPFPVAEHVLRTIWEISAR